MDWEILQYKTHQSNTTITFGFLEHIRSKEDYFFQISTFFEELRVRTRSRMQSEPVFVTLLWSPGTDFQTGWPVRPPYFCYTGQPDYIGWRNRFLGSLNVYKYGLWFGGHTSGVDCLSVARHPRLRKEKLQVAQVVLGHRRGVHYLQTGFRTKDHTTDGQALAAQPLSFIVCVTRRWEGMDRQICQPSTRRSAGGGV